MEDVLQVVIYVIAIILYLISRRKKSAQQKETTQQPNENREGRTYEQQMEAAAEQEVPMDLEDFIRQFGQSREEKPMAQPQITTRPQEERIKHAKPGQIRKEKKEIEADKDEKYQLKYQTFDEMKNYEQGYVGEPLEFNYQGKKMADKINPFAEILRDKEGIKKAFILSEILKRKY